MAWWTTIHTDLMEYEFLDWNQEPSEGSLMEFYSEPFAKGFLERLLQDPVNKNRLQGLLWLEPCFDHGCHSAMTDQQIIEQIAHRLVFGSLKLVERVRCLTPSGIPLGIWEPIKEVNQQAEVDPEPEIVKGAHWSSLKVVDDITDEPVEGVKLMITLPDGSQKEYTTNSSGLVEINELERGALDVSSNMEGASLKDMLSFVQYGSFSSGNKQDGDNQEPLSGTCITRVEEHKVKSGETLASIAEKAQMTWQQLAELNWGTSDPDEVNTYLHLEVGCLKKREIDDTYVLDDSDDPGIIYVPRPWERKALSLDRVFTIRVKRLSEQESFLFSA